MLYHRKKWGALEALFIVFKKKWGLGWGEQVPLAPNLHSSLKCIEKKQNMREKGKISHRDISDNIGDAN